MTNTVTSEVSLQTISLAELQYKLSTKRPLQFWNVLTDEWFKGEMIPQSRRVPLDQVGNEVRSSQLPKDTEIVVYCGGFKCPQSRMAAEKLVKLGFNNVFAFEGGVEEWKNAGLATEKA